MTFAGWTSAYKQVEEKKEETAQEPKDTLGDFMEICESIMRPDAPTSVTRSFIWPQLNTNFSVFFPKMSAKFWRTPLSPKKSGAAAGTTISHRFAFLWLPFAKNWNHSLIPLNISRHTSASDTAWLKCKCRTEDKAMSKMNPQHSNAMRRLPLTTSSPFQSPP